ncbi:hypothetical protein DSECCO2_588850 [anaerobic digester metagenome]
MCDVLGIPKSTFNYTSKQTAEPDPIINDVIEIFKSSRKNYGTRKIKYELKDRSIIATRRRIGCIMKENGFVSNYTVVQYKVYKQPINDDSFPNEVNLQFEGQNHLQVIVSRLTYVRVAGKSNYVCLIIDLYNSKFSKRNSLISKYFHP